MTELGLPRAERLTRQLVCAALTGPAQLDQGRD